ncbi:MAG: aminotransferase class III-fold pyridoxal phosphate-dependent enzyme [Fusobacterium periodonticum]|nr:aminotransferase class III-fold pyridoxal phosphate-dependent enzyme [Fusobacterium periodonticum]
MVFKNSIDLYKKALNLIPGGVNSPVRAFKSVNREAPIFVKKGQGAKIYDEDNNEYIDYICSWGPLILGHNHPKVIEEVKKIIENGSSYGLPTKYEVDLAELIVEIVPSIEKVRLTTSGTEATMSAVRLARAYTGRNKILKFEGCYHGHSDALLVKSGSGLLTDGYQDSNGITDGVLKDTLTLGFGDLEKVENLEDSLKANTENFSIYFNTMLDNGIVVPPSQFEAHFLSIAHTKKELDRTLEVMEMAFKKIGEKNAK